MKVSQLPLPQLAPRRLDALYILTDDALAHTTGVRVAFSGRAGGVSEAPYEGLNLATHVGDDPARVEQNRHALLHALGAQGMPLVVPNQVHGDNLVCVRGSDERSLHAAREAAARGADGLVVSTPDVAALLCFADCVPVVVVSPSGAFAVVHAGWRGVVASIAPKAVRTLAQYDVEQGFFSNEAAAAASYNVYLGPHIRVECFETGPEVRDQFVSAVGASCVEGECHVSLARALRTGLERAGVAPSRIADAGVCTACNPEVFYSYRAEGGACGRHGAIAFLQG